MVNNIVTGSYTETYDLNTAIGELSIIGVHTPQAPQLKKMFKGFFENYKKFRVVGCDLRMVCASQQTLTPDLVGLEAGQVDPRDVLNPILFKACTGDTLNSILDIAYNNLAVTGTGLTNNRAGSLNQTIQSHQKALDCYYQFLADDSFRKSHPQAGLTVSGLVPLVHRIVTTQPFKYVGSPLSNLSPLASQTGAVGFEDKSTPGSTTFYNGGAVNGGYINSSGVQTNTNAEQANYIMSNGTASMPWLDTAFEGGANVDTGAPASPSSQTSKFGQWIINSIPRVYMGCIVLPPAILQRLFFRMQIRWIIQFKDFRPAYEIGPIDEANVLFDKIGTLGTSSGYFNMYHSPTASKIATKEESSFSTNESVEISEVNQVVR